MNPGPKLIDDRSLNIFYLDPIGESRDDLIGRFLVERVVTLHENLVGPSNELRQALTDLVVMRSQLGTEWRKEWD